MYEKVKAYIKENQMIEPGCTVLCGISGGGDSMAMLSLLRKYQEEEQFSLGAVHVNHGIRGEEADRDEDLVRRTCEAWGIPFSAYHYPVPEIARERKLGTEEAGRLVRREAFGKEAKRLGLSEDRVRIALAHNENDLAETLLHNLCRGSGLRGLCSMHPVDGAIIRPVLCLEKKEIGDYLEKECVPHILDSTNLSDEYTRNRIRHHILPLMEQQVNTKAAAHIAETARLLFQAEEYLGKQGEALLDRFAEKAPGQGGISLPAEFFAQEPAVVSYGLLTAFDRLAGKRKDFASVHVALVLGLMDRQVGRKICLPYELLAERTYEGLKIYRQKAETAQGKGGEWQITVPGVTEGPFGSLRAEIFSYQNEKIEENKYTKWLDYDIIEYNLSVRTRRTGDFLIVDSRGSKKKLNRILIDEKVPAAKRDGIPLVAAGDEILWIIGGRINERYKITPETRRVLVLEYKGGINYHE